MSIKPVMYKQTESHSDNKFCLHCNKFSPYRVTEEIKEYEIYSTKMNVLVKEGFCCNCSYKMLLPHLVEENIKTVKETYEKKKLYYEEKNE